MSLSKEKNKLNTHVQSGLTLIELMIAVAIIGILAASIGPTSVTSYVVSFQIQPQDHLCTGVDTATPSNSSLVTLTLSSTETTCAVNIQSTKGDSGNNNNTGDCTAGVVVAPSSCGSWR